MRLSWTGKPTCACLCAALDRVRAVHAHDYSCPRAFAFCCLPRGAASLLSAY